MLANGKRADLYPKANSTDSQWARAFKGELQELYRIEGGVYMQKEYSQLSESS